jgi:energy-coupling factor transporter ATP-binding protein EcfA2
VIRWTGVTVTYDGGAGPTLAGVDVEVGEGELCAVVGRTGSGKSTLLGTVNGHVPHFTGGHLDGTVRVDGRDTRDHPPRELADVVGVVGQDPLAGFVADVVEDELAYGMEQLALPAATMRRRVEETLDLLGLADLRRRPLRTLSGGQQQRVAIGAAFCPHPRVLVLDEPTSSLDPTAAEEVLAAVSRLVHDLGVTVLLAEHRMERVAQFADRVLWLPGDGRVVPGDPAALLAAAGAGPPVLDLGRVAGWSPLPLSVRDARRRAPELRARLPEAPPPPPDPAGDAVLDAAGVVVRHGPVVAVRGVDLTLGAGEVTALMGRNGSGKSSLLWALQGSGGRAAGTVAVAGADPARLDPAPRRRLVGLVPQSPADLLYLSTVGAELAAADEEVGAEPGSARTLLDGLVPGIGDDPHPRDLSEGQRLAVALAVQLVAAPPVVLLDEPTRGLDHAAKDRLTTVLRRLAAERRAIVLSTHDVELAAAVADRVVVLAEGEVIVDGPTAEVVASSPAFAPQVARVLLPAPWLTVDQVRTALAPGGGS